MTRAKRRLVLLGNFGWLQTRGRGAFVGGELLPYLLDKHRAIPGLELWSQLAAASQRTRPLPSTEVVKELAWLVSATRQQLVVFSPALTASRLSDLASPLMAAAGRGVEVLLVTRPLHEEGASQNSERRALAETISSLRTSRVTVLYKSRMHEKLVLADERMVLFTTFSPLAEVPVDGCVDRHGKLDALRATPLHQEISECLGLEYVFKAIHEHQLRCPVCASEMWLADTIPGSNQPFYWRCERNDCFTRSLREAGVVDGLITLACNGHPSLDYHGDPVWTCDCGRRHRTKVKKAHLLLPKMWSLVAERRRARLLREMGLSVEDLFRQGNPGL